MQRNFICVKMEKSIIFRGSVWIWNGFPRLQTRSAREKRKKFGITEDDFFLVSVGELNENKNQQIILRALEQMRRAGKDISKIKYGICGDGFFREKIEMMIRTLGLEQNVRMFGYCMDVREVLGCADVSVFHPGERDSEWRGWKRWPWKSRFLPQKTGGRGNI